MGSTLFDGFIADRRRKLSKLISDAMGKPVNLIPEGGEYEENGEAEAANDRV